MSILKWETWLPFWNDIMSYVITPLAAVIWWHHFSDVMTSHCDHMMWHHFRCHDITLWSLKWCHVTSVITCYDIISDVMTSHCDHWNDVMTSFWCHITSVITWYDIISDVMTSVITCHHTLSGSNLMTCDAMSFQNGSHVSHFEIDILPISKIVITCHQITAAKGVMTCSVKFLTQKLAFA